MGSKFMGRHGYLRAVLTVFLVLAPWINASAKPLSSVADLRYGVTLYEYYQGNYLQALSELMVAEARGGIKGHKDNPKLIEGGISLAFGMERKAGEIFAELLTEERPLAVRNAAWFYLGKLRYLRGDWSGTEVSIDRITGEFEPSLATELSALKVNLAIRRGDLAAAKNLIDNSKGLLEWQPYMYYNLGAAHSRANEHSQALAYYSALTELPVPESPQQQQEHLALYDKALTAAGYSLMLQGQYGAAMEQFTQVRLLSDFSGRALLGYGWAAAESDDYTRALKPWQALSQRSLTNAAAQEAVLAVPYAYEKLGAPGQALASFEAAQNTFEDEIGRIDSVLASLDRQALLDVLKVVDKTHSSNWFSLGAELDKIDTVTPRETYLTELFSQNTFQGAVQELQDLLRLQESLQGWEEKLDAYDLMLQERDIARDAKAQDIATRDLQQRRQQLITKRDQFVAYIERINAEKDYLALAEGETSELYKIVQRIEKSIARLRDAGEPVDDYLELLHRYRGVLLWQASESFSDQLWKSRKSLAGLNKALAELEENHKRLDSVVDTAPDVAPYQSRIQVLEQRLTLQRQRVDQTVALAETKLREQVADRLHQQRRRLRHYLAQARLSVARLYDTAMRERQ